MWRLHGQTYLSLHVPLVDSFIGQWLEKQRQQLQIAPQNCVRRQLRHRQIMSQIVHAGS